MSSRGLNTNKALLPRGFEDLLPPEAGDEAYVIHELMQSFSAFGFERVKPPLLEFEESLFAPGPGEALIDQSFRVMDPISHKMMGLRADITAQIARIASSRLKTQERPLRLAYANDVLRTKASQHRTLRQFCQVGCEIIGAADTEMDIEACVVAVIGLKALGIENLTIDIVFPAIIRRMIDALDFEPEQRESFSAALEKRDLAALENLPDNVLGTLNSLKEASGPAEEAFKTLETLSENVVAKADIEYLKNFYAGVQKALKELGYSDVTLTIDPLENKLFEYHNGVAFTVFAKDARGELGCGGRYDVAQHNGGESETATGFTLYMDTVRTVMPRRKHPETKVVDASQSWAKLLELQKQGYRVIRQTKEESV